MYNRRYKGIYLAFEGGEGAGKSTQIKLLEEKFRKEFPERKIVSAREPGGTKVGEAIRQILLEMPVDQGEMQARTEALLFAAARSQFLLEVVKPVLLEGGIVLADRCYLSSLVYQGVGRGLGIAYVRQINEGVIRNLFPDLIVLLDIDPEIGLTRRNVSAKKDRLDREEIEFHRQVRHGYLLLAESDPGHILKVDASLSKETQSDQIFNEVKRRFFVDREPVREINLTSKMNVEF